MEDTTIDIDNRLLPGSSTSVLTALERVEGLARDARESHALTKRLAARLDFLRREFRSSTVLASDTTKRTKLVVRFSKAISDVLRFLQKFAKKKAIQRIASSRLVRDGVRRLHSTIDILFEDAGLADAPAMAEWKSHEAADIQAQLERLREIVTISGAIVNDLSTSDVEEALLEIRLEIERRNNPPEFVELLTRAQEHPEVAAKKRVAVRPGLEHHEHTAVVERKLEPWFCRRDVIDLADQPFEMGSYGDVYRGKRGSEGADVCVKLLLVDGPDAQAQFLREATIWFSLNHPNVIKMLGGCHVGTPLFFISELAKAGNFVDYLYKSENKSHLWCLFLQAAQGLSYLHSERVVHGDIKCNNLLVGDDGQAKLCDFGFSYIKTLSIGKSLKAQPDSTPWKAPECVLETGPAANLSVQSDVYSLGMSIVEAKTGSVPWGVVSEDEIIENLMDGQEYPRPDGIFSDREWELVQGMTRFDPEKRWSLDRAIDVLKELAGVDTEESKEAEKADEVSEVSEVQQALKNLAVAATSSRTVQCSACQNISSTSNRFCGNCGAKLPP